MVALYLNKATDRRRLVKAENAFTIAEAHAPVHLAPVAVIAPLAALAWVAVSGPAGELVVEGVVQDLEIALGDAVLVVVGPALDHRIEGVDETCLRRTAMVLDDVPQLAVDRALGVGGVPRSRITEILSPEGGGKTTLAQHIVAEAQKLGGTAVYIDMEHAVDLAYTECRRAAWIPARCTSASQTVAPTRSTSSASW